MYMYCIYIYIYICQYSRNTNMKISPAYWLRVVLYQFVLVESTIFVENERVWVQNWVEWNQKGWSLFRSEAIHLVFYLWWGIKSWKRNITMVCSFFVVQLHMSDLPLPCLITGGYALVGKGSYMDLSFISKRGDAQNPRIAIGPYRDGFKSFNGTIASRGLWISRSHPVNPQVFWCGYPDRWPGIAGMPWSSLEPCGIPWLWTGGLCSE